MRFGDLERPVLDAGLQTFAQLHHDLPGIPSSEQRKVLVEQLIESIRRIEYVRRTTQMKLSPQRANPASNLFDPLKAAILLNRVDNVDEAFWLTFLATHFGRHLKDHWQLVRDIYRGFGGAGTWTWNRVSANLADFGNWLTQQYPVLTSDGVGRRFGNHRKYETLNPHSPRGTGRAIQSYVAWVGPNRGHSLLLSDARHEVGTDPKAIFKHLYDSMNVVSFGRTAKFDFLAMAGKLSLANIEPGSPYLKGSTGPLSGAKLLFAGSKTASLPVATLDDLAVQLGNYLGLPMQAMEDAICNWHKSPNTFVPFRG